eukprot:Gb_31102 [translate_table: standard]
MVVEPVPAPISSKADQVSVEASIIIEKDSTLNSLREGSTDTSSKVIQVEASAACMLRKKLENSHQNAPSMVLCGGDLLVKLSLVGEGPFGTEIECSPEVIIQTTSLKCLSKGMSDLKCLAPMPAPYASCSPQSALFHKENREEETMDGVDDRSGKVSGQSPSRAPIEGDPKAIWADILGSHAEDGRSLAVGKEKDPAQGQPGKEYSREEFSSTGLENSEQGVILASYVSPGLISQILKER